MKNLVIGAVSALLLTAIVGFTAYNRVSCFTTLVQKHEVAGIRCRNPNEITTGAISTAPPVLQCALIEVSCQLN